MPWCTPSTLEELSSRVVAESIVCASEHKIRKHMLTVSSKVLRHHVKLGQLNDVAISETSDVGRNKSAAQCSSGSPSSTRYPISEKKLQEYASSRRRRDTNISAVKSEIADVPCLCPSNPEECCFQKSMIAVKAILMAVQRFWETLPLCGPRHILDAVLDTSTEVHPSQDRDFMQHIVKLCLKLIILETVFIDRDYGDRDKLCVIPFIWVDWTAGLIDAFKSLRIKKMSCYGAMYPNILESILKISPAIQELNLSHLNITDDLLIVSSEHCKNLETLRLLHCYPWLVISPQGFAKAFFGHESCDYVLQCLKTNQREKLKMTFRKLKHIELSYGPVTTITQFHILLLAGYSDVKFLYSDWKSNFFDDGYENYCEDVINEVITFSGSLSIEDVFIKADLIYDFTDDDIKRLLWNCPFLSNLRIDCRVVRSRSSPIALKRIGDRLAKIAKGQKNISALYCNVARENYTSQTIILPFLLMRATTLTEVTIEACNPSEQISVSLIKLVLETCPFIKRLKIKVWTRSLIQFPSLDTDAISLPERPSLREILIHEAGPGEDESSSSICKLWLILLNSLVVCAPNLQCFSFTICEGLINILTKFKSNLERLHVHILDGHVWQPSELQLKTFVRNHPNLNDLYLEELPGPLFWKLRQIVKESLLKIHWGNMDGWPRS